MVSEDSKDDKGNNSGQTSDTVTAKGDNAGDKESTVQDEKVRGIFVCKLEILECLLFFSLPVSKKKSGYCDHLDCCHCCARTLM